MALSPFVSVMLEHETRALLTRLVRLQPFALQETMLPAANLLPSAQVAIEGFLMAGRRHLRSVAEDFLRWLRSPQASRTTAEHAQRRFTMLRLRFNAVLTQFDVFQNVITQRSEHETGVWLSGLDVVSADALQLRGNFYESPPIICYLDRGVGAAIRRARTRLPGGGDNPVAIIKVPRERMVGTGIASSLIHEVGHQAAALLNLVESIRPVLGGLARGSRSDSEAWRLWDRWISEIAADFWSVARVGVASTMGLMGVVSLPRAFVFRLNVDDPHPVPWIRVKLSAALGRVLHPQPIWDRLSAIWESYYPLEGLDLRQREIFNMLERTIPGLVAILVNHRPAALRGRTLAEAMDLEEFRPELLRAALQRWRASPDQMYRVRPLFAFAVIGQGRAENQISPEEESTVLGKLLTHWALSSTMQAAAGCVPPAPRRCQCQGRVKRKQISEPTRSMSWSI
jgi:hypothetical protein